MNQDCRNYRLLIPQALYGDLDASSRKGLEEHLDNCPSCAAERQAMTSTVEELRTHVDLPVPRHFTLPDKDRLLNPGRSFLYFLHGLFRSWAWAPAFLLLLAAVIFWMKPWSSIPSTTTAVLTQADLEAFRASLFQSLEAKSKAEKAEWLTLLRTEMSGLSQTLDDRQRKHLQTAIARMENRVGQRLQASELRQHAANNLSTMQIVEWLQSQQNSLAVLNDQIQRVARTDRQRGVETDQLFAVLIKAQASERP